MTSLLRIDASPRIGNSDSRALGDHLQRRWEAANPQGKTTIRDLASEPLPHLDQSAISAFFTDPAERDGDLQKAIALSDRLVEELQSSETLLITVPIYNFGVPSALKAWIDHIVRIGVTFSFDGTSFEGLANAQSAYVLCSYGADGYGDNGPLRPANFLEPYLHFLLTFLGISNIHFVAFEGTTKTPDIAKQAQLQAFKQIDTMKLQA